MRDSSKIALIISISIVIYLVIDKTLGSGSKKIGVVQMEKLVYDFKGMKEATENYSQKIKKWSSQSDSLENKLKELYNQLRLDSLSKNQAQLDKDIKIFMIFKQSYVDYVQNNQANAEKEDKQMTLGVVNQINEYIKLYAKQKGFDVILCNSQQQSVGYVKDQLDITEDVLEFSNKQYEGIK